MTTDDRKTKVALAEYKEVLTQFRKLTDIRFKLLTYLPLGTVAGTIVVRRDSDRVKQAAISAFAFVVTLCIATYNKRNDQLYDTLVARAAELEREELKIEHGYFATRPKAWHKYGRVTVDHRPSIGVIYAASASLWAYLFTAALIEDPHTLMWLAVGASAIVFAGWRWLRLTDNDRMAARREAVAGLMRLLLERDDDNPQRELATAIGKRKWILGIDQCNAERRIAYHWNKYKKGDSRSASALLSAVIDLPPLWIEDVYTGRRAE
jgi:hypothetical protein